LNIRWTRWVLPAVVIAVVVLAVLFLSPLAGVWGVPYHDACVRTDLIGPPVVLWTPLLVLDSPLNGSANATALMMGTNGLPEPGVGAHAAASDGASVGVFLLLPWSVYSVATKFVAGPGPAFPCAAAYEAVPSVATPATPSMEVTLLGAGTASDSDVPDSVVAQGVGSVLFNADWPGGTNFVETCGPDGGPGAVSTSLSGVPAVVPGSSFGGRNVSVTVPDEASYSYSFPVGGSWGIGPSPSAGFAFEYYGC
jgi:hypothetical protein